jgi:hypothetical protein
MGSKILALHSVVPENGKYHVTGKGGIFVIKY